MSRRLQPVGLKGQEMPTAYVNDKPVELGTRKLNCVQAADLLPEKEPQVRGLTSRKILVLQRYLRRIRAAASGEGDPGNHVPRAAE